MKAIVWTKYGSPEGLQLQEIARPVPNDDEVLIRVRATTVTTGDCEMRRLQMPMMLGLPVRVYAGLAKPKRVKILGQEFAGEIEAIGANVSAYGTGDQVYGMTGFGSGTYAEYICRPEVPGDMDGAMVAKPVSLTFGEAAAVPLGGLEALHHLRQADIHSGEHVLINGAGGSIGTMAIQLAKLYAAEVTAVDSGPKLAMLRAIGADHVIDYAQEDFTRRNETYDVILDVVGKSPFAGSLRSLTNSGRYVLANPRLSHMVRGPWASMRTGKQVLSGTSSPKGEDLLYLKDLIEQDQIRVIIDRCYALAQMAEAHRYVETGQKQGNVVIKV